MARVGAPPAFIVFSKMLVVIMHYVSININCEACGWGLDLNSEMMVAKTYNPLIAQSWTGT